MINAALLLLLLVSGCDQQPIAFLDGGADDAAEEPRCETLITYATDMRQLVCRDGGR